MNTTSMRFRIPSNTNRLPVDKPLEAFENAIADGVFVTDEYKASRFCFDSGSFEVSDYVGDWMYMFTNTDGQDAFKNKVTRQYLYVGHYHVES